MDIIGGLGQAVTSSAARVDIHNPVHSAGTPTKLVNAINNADFDNAQCQQSISMAMEDWPIW